MSLKFVPEATMNNKTALVQVMVQVDTGTTTLRLFETTKLTTIIRPSILKSPDSKRGSPASLDTHFKSGLGAHNSHLVKIGVVFVWRMVIRSGHKFAHVTTAELSRPCPVAPTGDAPTTSGWSTILLATKMCLVLAVWMYIEIWAPWMSYYIHRFLSVM